MSNAAIARPRVFISSTVADLRDVRSALRFWLEQAGYDVQLSEYNDFTRDVDSDTLHACFDNVSQSDFYVLLVGKRRGAWFNEDDRITITRQEFRVARDASLSKSLGIFLFERREVDVALRQWTEDGCPEPDTPGRYVEDPVFTSEFMAELEEPTSAASAAPWIYKFDDFRDIVDGLRVPLRLTTDFERRLLRGNLLDEVIRDVCKLMTKGQSSKTLSFLHQFSTRTRDGIAVQADNLRGDTKLSRDQIRGLGFLLLARPTEALEHSAIDESLARGLFLDFDQQTGSISPTVEHEALRRIKDDLKRVTSVLDRADADELANYFEPLVIAANKRELNGSYPINTFKLASLLAIHDRLDDLCTSLVQMAKCLLGYEKSPQINRRPNSVVHGVSEELEAEMVDPAELRWALSKDIYPFGVTLTEKLRDSLRKVEGGYVEDLRKIVPPELIDDDGLAKLVTESFDARVVEPYQKEPPITRRAPRDTA